LDEPEKMLAPLLEKFFSERGPQIADSRIQNVQEKAFADNYVYENRQWLMELDPQGQPKKDFRGGNVLTPAGRMFAQVVQQLTDAGVLNPQLVQQMAEKQVFGAMALARLNSGQQAQQQSEAGKQNLLAAAPQYTAPGPQSQGNAANPAPNFSAPRPGASMNMASQFRNELTGQLAANGYAV
jgi:hypothetical protein